MQLGKQSNLKCNKRKKKHGIKLLKGEKLVYRKLQSIGEIRHKQMEIYLIMFMNWKTIELKCPYYSRWSTDSMQSLAKFQWHFSEKELGKNNSEFHVGTHKKRTNSQSNFEKEE